MKEIGLIFAVLVALLIGDSQDASRTPTPRQQMQSILGNVKRFAYQLQNFKVKKAAASEAQMLVIDPQTDTGRLTAGDIKSLQSMPDKSRRLVIAYLSIGEAEDYRPYWKKSWSTTPPSWLGPENPDWRGNFEVRYWDRGWQSVILGSDSASLDLILAAGFDGVYLDIVDGFEFWEAHKITDAKKRMIAWVTRIADYSRSKKPGFLVIPQNGEALGAFPEYLNVIDALGKEDLFFDGDHRQPADATREVQADIKRFQAAGKPVFLIEYPTAKTRIDEVYSRAKSAGYLPLVTARDLDRLVVTKP